MPSWQSCYGSGFELDGGFRQLAIERAIRAWLHAKRRPRLLVAAIILLIVLAEDRFELLGEIVIKRMTLAPTGVPVVTSSSVRLPVVSATPPLVCGRSKSMR